MNAVHNSWNLLFHDNVRDVKSLQLGNILRITTSTCPENSNIYQRFQGNGSHIPKILSFGVV